ncbi:MAG: isopentenyl phosphate kinase family protein [Candidatus Daviesbacteria bacterium]|nr:MAG: isopentenyl phosphate kinase family protein [Candidatus Daviesbacteria bacterium]
MPEDKDVILIKLGGSVVTVKDSSNPAPQLQNIDQLAKELHRARKKTGVKMILGHGAGSYGHPQAAKYHTMEGVVDENSLIGASEVRLSVVELNSIITKRLLSAGEPVVSLPPAALLTSADGSVVSIFPNPVVNFLKIGMLPVIFGDVISDEKKGFTIFSGEQVLNLLASNLAKFGLNPKFVIEVGETAGVYGDLSKKDTIPLINKDNFAEIEDKLGGSASTDVTGGMAHKVKEAYQLAQNGIPTLLISADEGNLYKAILGQSVIGTWIR